MNLFRFWNEQYTRSVKKYLLFSLETYYTAFCFWILPVDNGICEPMTVHTKSLFLFFRIWRQNSFIASISRSIISVRSPIAPTMPVTICLIRMSWMTLTRPEYSSFFEQTKAASVYHGVAAKAVYGRIFSSPFLSFEIDLPVANASG